MGSFHTERNKHNFVIGGHCTVAQEHGGVCDGFLLAAESGRLIQISCNLMPTDNCITMLKENNEGNTKPMISTNVH